MAVRGILCLLPCQDQFWGPTSLMFSGVLVSSMYGANYISPCSAMTRMCVVSPPVPHMVLTWVLSIWTGEKRNAVKWRNSEHPEVFINTLPPAKLFWFISDYHYIRILPHCSVIYSFPEKYHNNAYMLGKCLERLNAILIFFICLHTIILLKME